MESDLVAKIKSRGYWRVVIRPTEFNKQLIPSLAECSRLLYEAKVSLRGWDYPHIDRDGPTNGLDWVECSTDALEIYEYWRFYQSGQFAHLFNCREDWVAPPQLGVVSWKKLPPSSAVLSILSTLYRITEIYEFAARLASKKVIPYRLSVEIELHGMKDRTLVLTDPMRAPLLELYTCKVDSLPQPARVVSTAELLERSSEFALESIIWFFERFNWRDIPTDILRNDQRKLLERRL